MGFHVNIENKTLFYHIFENPNIFRTFVEIKNKLVIFTPFFVVVESNWDLCTVSW